jgi:hypothetical protein
MILVCLSAVIMLMLMPIPSASAYRKKRIKEKMIDKIIKNKIKRKKAVIKN